jgi:hypothetical protein
VALRGSAARELSHEQYESIVEDLEKIKGRGIDKDGKLKIVGKDEIKEHRGRSPDFADCLMMRMWFALQPAPAAVGVWFVGE